MNFIVTDVISEVSTTVYIKFTSFCSLMPCSVVASFRLPIFGPDIGEGISPKPLYLPTKLYGVTFLKLSSLTL